MFFNIGGGELLVIAMVALIAVGPEQLPVVLRKVGRAVAQFRSMTAGLREEFMSGLDEVNELADPVRWMGSGSNDDPVVPRGYAARRAAAGDDPADDEAGVNADDDSAAEDPAGAGGPRPTAAADEGSPSTNGGAGGGRRVNQIAQANAMRSADRQPVEPAIGGASSTEPRSDRDAAAGSDANGDREADAPPTPAPQPEVVADPPDQSPDAAPVRRPEEPA